MIIVNWNGRQFLEKCLPSIFSSTYKATEVIVADCASRDRSVQFIKSNYPNVRLLTFDKDPGFDYANNCCISLATGDYVILLNNDVVLPPKTIKQLVEDLKEDEHSIVAALEKDWKGQFWSNGVAYHWLIGAYLVLRLLGSRERLCRFGNEPFYVGIVCTISAKDVMRSVRLNEHLIFYEDFEWCWRLRLDGVRVRVSSDAFVYHKGSGTIEKSTKAAFYSGRAMIASHYICLSHKSVLVFGPLLLSYYLSKVLVYLGSGRVKSAKSFVRGLGSFFRDIEAFKADRQSTQRTRRITDRMVFEMMIGSCHYSYGKLSFGTVLHQYSRKILNAP